MCNFDLCIPVILRNEGGYVNNMNDSGGETKYGISKRAYPNEDIKNLTIERAKELYLRDYWNPCNLDLIIDSNNALQIFDHAVNAGRIVAVQMAQKVVKTTTDGKLGKITAGLINTMLDSDFLQQFKQARVDFYNQIAKRGNNKIFLKGWLNRVNNTHL
jgi:lysozyme family protein